MPKIDILVTDTVTPTEADVNRAELIKHFAYSDKVEFHAKVVKAGNDILVSESAGKIFLSIINKIAEGQTVELVSYERELTTQEAADILKVSRPHLIRLLNENRIPFYWVGSHRRVLYKDIKAYGIRRWSRRKETLDRLSALDQELGLTE